MISLMLAAVLQFSHMTSDTVDVSQGVYVCGPTSPGSLRALSNIVDGARRRALARRMGCRFSLGPREELYPVARRVEEICTSGTRYHCDELSWSVVVYMAGRPVTIMSTWRDEDRD